MALGWFRRPERDLPHCLIDMLSELLEIVSEQANELQGSGVIFRAIGPGLPRIENLAVDARHADRNFETEILIHPEFRIVQATIKRRIEQRARNLDGHTAADTIFAAGPAGIDQPARNAALGDPLFRSEEHTPELQSLMRI